MNGRQSTIWAVIILVMAVGAGLTWGLGGALFGGGLAIAIMTAAETCKR